MDRNVQPGDWVMLPRGEGWLRGMVVRVKRRTWIHVEVGDDFMGRRVYREALQQLREVADDRPKENS